MPGIHRFGGKGTVVVGERERVAMIGGVEPSLGGKDVDAIRRKRLGAVQRVASRLEVPGFSEREAQPDQSIDVLPEVATIESNTAAARCGCPMSRCRRPIHSLAAMSSGLAAARAWKALQRVGVVSAPGNPLGLGTCIRLLGRVHAERE